MTTKPTHVWVVWGDLTISADPPVVFRKQTDAQAYILAQVTEVWDEEWGPVPPDWEEARDALQNHAMDTWAGSLELDECPLLDGPEVT